MRRSFVLLLLLGSSLNAMVRAGVDVGPNSGYDETAVYYDTWYGPGWYYGIYFSDYPTYYSWRRNHYYGGPYYWRHNHYRGSHHGGHQGKHHGKRH